MNILREFTFSFAWYIDVKLCHYSRGLYALMEPREATGTNPVETNELN